MLEYTTAGGQRRPGSVLERRRGTRTCRSAFSLEPRSNAAIGSSTSGFNTTRQSHCTCLLCPHMGMPLQHIACMGFPTPCEGCEAAAYLQIGYSRNSLLLFFSTYQPCFLLSSTTFVCPTSLLYSSIPVSVQALLSKHPLKSPQKTGFSVPCGRLRVCICAGAISNLIKSNEKGIADQAKRAQLRRHAMNMPLYRRQRHARFEVPPSRGAVFT